MIQKDTKILSSTSRSRSFNIMIDGRKYEVPIKNEVKTYENIGKFTTSQGDDYTTGCFLDYNYFKKTL